MYNEIKLTTVFKPYKDYLVIDSQSMVLQLLDKLYFLNEQIINENVASSKAMSKLAINPSMYSLGNDGFQIDKIMEL
jgi:uncharacterized protein (DUF1499 family)